MLKQDHRKVEQLSDQVEQSDHDERKEGVAAQICTERIVHTGRRSTIPPAAAAASRTTRWTRARSSMTAPRGCQRPARGRCQPDSRGSDDRFRGGNERGYGMRQRYEEGDTAGDRSGRRGTGQHRDAGGGIADQRGIDQMAQADAASSLKLMSAQSGRPRSLRRGLPRHLAEDWEGSFIF